MCSQLPPELVSSILKKKSEINCQSDNKTILGETSERTSRFEKEVRISSEEGDEQHEI